MTSRTETQPVLKSSSTTHLTFLSFLPKEKVQTLTARWQSSWESQREIIF